jgi:hypothetical protein
MAVRWRPGPPDAAVQWQSWRRGAARATVRPPFGTCQSWRPRLWPPHSLARPRTYLYAGDTLGAPIRTPRREVPASLRGLTLGVGHSRGPISVSPLIGADSRCRLSVSTAALSVEGLRTAVSPDPLPGPVLRCGVPPTGGTVAPLAQRPDVPVQRRGEAKPARAVASLPGTLSATPSSPLGANAAEHRSSGSGGSRGGAAGY